MRAGAALLLVLVSCTSIRTPGAPGPGPAQPAATPSVETPSAGTPPADVLPTVAPPGGAPDQADSAAFEVLGAHDLLEITVFDIEELSRTVRVAEDGAITLPFLGRVVAAGLTRSDLESRLAGLLADRYIQDPQVSVFVKEFNSRKVSVSGAVKNPATFELMGARRLLDVIAEAGGFSEDVGRTVYVIRRRPSGAPDRIQVDLERLIYLGDAAQNVVIQPGDVVYAPIVEMITIYVNGAVRSPGSYDFRHGDQITVLRAITKAGGATDRAAEGRVQILRLNGDGSQSLIPVDLRKILNGKVPDPLLQRDDVVDVPEAFF